MPNEIQIRPLHSLAEFDECVRLQQLTWGRDIVVPTAIFVVGEHTGGLSHGAFEGGRMAGFTMALAGYRDGQAFLHSHMAAVLPEYQNRGIGRRLKLAQRDDALAKGIRLIEWTFDPLELKNAYFNFNRLGIVARRYLPNCYGITDSPVHGGLPTDRLVAEWWIDSPRVRALLAEGPQTVRAATSIAIPCDIAAVKMSDRTAALNIQSSLREQFQERFGQGLAATSVEKSTQTLNYLLEPASTILGVDPSPRGH